MTDLQNVIPLAKALMAEESVTPNAAGCFDLIDDWLSQMGFTVWREVFTEEGYEPTENLYARLGDSAPNVCFAGHVDVVPAGFVENWDIPPFEPQVRDGFLHGRGAEDMKAAIAAFISACSIYLSEDKNADSRESEYRLNAKGSISFLLTADEEGIAINGTPKLLKWLDDKGEKLDYCLVGEPTNPTYLGEMCKIGRRGSLLSTLRIEGHQGHIAYPHLADNPITPLVEILHKLKTHKLDEGNDYFQPSNLEITTIDVGNEAHNMIPAKAMAEFNIRFNDEHSGESLQHWICSVCNSVGHDYKLEMRISGESFLTAEGKLSEAIVNASEKITGHRPELSTTGGTSDARFIKDYCPVIEFGTTGFTPHKINERVQVEVVEKLRDVYVEFLGEML